MVEAGHRQVRQSINAAEVDERLLAGDPLGLEQRTHQCNVVLAVAVSVLEHGRCGVRCDAARAQEYHYVSNVLLDPTVDGRGLSASVADALGNLVGKRLDFRSYDILVLHARPIAGAKLHLVPEAGDEKLGIAVHRQNRSRLVGRPAFRAIAEDMTPIAAGASDLVTQAVTPDMSPERDGFRHVDRETKGIVRDRLG